MCLRVLDLGFGGFGFKTLGSFLVAVKEQSTF